VIKKELGGKKLPVPPANIRRCSRRKLLTSFSENSKSALSVPLTEDDDVDVKPHKHKKAHFKDLEACVRQRSEPLLNKVESDEERSPETEILTDDENHNRKSDDSITSCEEIVKEKFGLEADVNLPDSKVECEEKETEELKLEKKRKPMIIASHITVAQGRIKTHLSTLCKSCYWCQFAGGS
jgi:hypothetical protein